MINTRTVVKWIYLGPVAISLIADLGWSFGFGFHVDLNPPALDLFFLIFCLGITTRSHGEWIENQQKAYFEIGGK